jgi:hypothetical protein
MRTTIKSLVVTFTLLLPLLTSAQVNYVLTTNASVITAYVTNSPNVSGNIGIATNYDGYPVTSIGDDAFYYCYNLTGVTMSSNVISIGNSAFEGCSSLTNVTMGKNVASIEDYAFLDCSSLIIITVPNNVTNIGDYAFGGCMSLTNIAVGTSNPDYNTASGVLFNKAQTTLVAFPGGIDGSYTIPNSVINIGDEAFYSCSGLTSVTIANGVTSIGEYAFYSCSSLTNITVPNNVTNIEGYVFGFCSSLTNIAVAASNPDYSSTNGVLFNKARTTLIAFPGGGGGSYAIPNGVTNIEDEAFYSCSGLTSISISNSVTKIGDYVFDGCTSLTNIAVATSNPDYSSANGVLFNKAQTTLVAFPGGGGGSYTIPNSVTSIEEGAFESCSGLTNVDTGNGVTNIGTNAFEFCTGLTSVTIGNSVTSIGYEAFYYCYGLTSVTIPSSVASIGDYAFYDCANLTNLTFLGNAPTLGGPSVFDSVSAEATVSYYAGKSGWGLTYGGLTTMELSAAPQLGSGIGIHTGNFGFTIIGVNNQVITVEASTNLVNWQVIQTITLSGTSTNITDTQWKNYPRRFYRAQ